MAVIIVITDGVRAIIAVTVGDNFTIPRELNA